MPVWISKLPPKLDLNPQETIHVKPGVLLLLQIDFDAGNSLHIVEKGNGGFNFRPVVIADVLSVRLPGKLVLLEGVVEELDLDEIVEAVKEGAQGKIVEVEDEEDNERVQIYIE